MTTTGVLLDVIDLHGQVTELGLDLPGVMDLVVHKVLDLVQAQGAAIELADGDSMVYRAVAGTASGQLGLRVDRARSLSGQCIATGSWLKCDDTHSDVRVDRAACEAVGVRSMIVAPLSHRGQCVGVLKAFSGEPGHFSDGDAAVLGLLSRVVGTTMYWATRYGESDLFHRATHDDLTGLANRALFMDRLHAAIGAARRVEARLAVMLLDMDGLKQVNDVHGHAAGDATLMEFAARLHRTVGGQELVARLSGDEFAVLLSHAAEVDDIYALEQRLRSAIAAPFEVAGLHLRLAASWGVAQFPRDADDADALMAVADERMLQLKRARRASHGDAPVESHLCI